MAPGAEEGREKGKKKKKKKMGDGGGVGRNEGRARRIGSAPTNLTPGMITTAEEQGSKAWNSPIPEERWRRSCALGGDHGRIP